MVSQRAAGLGEDWTPRELRHSFVSILSASGTRIEDISDLMGHSGTERPTADVSGTQTGPGASGWPRAFVLPVGVFALPWVLATMPSRSSIANT